MKCLHADTTVKLSSEHALFFQSACSFRSCSVRSKLHPLEGASCKGKTSRCLKSENDDKECNKCSCYITKEVFKTNYHFNRNNKCLSD